MDRPGLTWGNLALAFTLELSGLAAYGYWGARTGDQPLTRLTLGVGAPLGAAVLWGIVAAPHAPVASPVATAAIQIAFHLEAALALDATGHPHLAAAFLCLVTSNTLARRWLADGRRPDQPLGATRPG